tara:strand:+ start:200 stop:808 length:609 start_codon:yes stop_codon:yes gene_type:complete
VTDFGPEHFIGGRLCVDFCNTADGRETAFVDALTEPADAVRWMTVSGAWHDGDAAALDAHLADTGAWERFHATAHDLREAIYAALTTRMHDGQPAAQALDRLATHYRAMAGRAALVTRANGQTQPDWSGADAATRFLAPIVMDAVALLAEDNAVRLKQCDGERCGWLFLDTSKAGRRRWCDMATCGNVSKARRHAARKQPSS